MRPMLFGSDPYAPVLPPSDAVACGFFLRRAGPEPLWLMLRSAHHGEWGFPKGHQDPGESLFQTALRECAEECGIALLTVTGPPCWLTYKPSGTRIKTTLYFPAQTTCETVVLSHEHSEASWFTKEQVLKKLNHKNLAQLFAQHAH